MKSGMSYKREVWWFRSKLETPILQRSRNFNNLLSKKSCFFDNSCLGSCTLYTRRVGMQSHLRSVEIANSAHSQSNEVKLNQCARPECDVGDLGEWLHFHTIYRRAPENQKIFRKCRNLKGSPEIPSHRALQLMWGEKF